MQPLNEKERNAVVADIIELSRLQQITPGKRTTREQTTIDDIQSTLDNDMIGLFTALTERGFIEIDMCIEEGNFTEWESILSDTRTHPPKIPNVSNTEEINNLIDHLYMAQTTISLKLEQIEDLYVRTDAIVHRAEEIFNTLVSTDTKWKSKGLFHIIVPEKITHTLARLTGIRDQFKIRTNLLENCRRDISRKLTAIMDTNIDPISRINTSEIFNKSAGRRRRNTEEVV